MNSIALSPDVATCGSGAAGPYFGEFSFLHRPLGRTDLAFRGLLPRALDPASSHEEPRGTLSRAQNKALCQRSAPGIELI